MRTMTRQTPVGLRTRDALANDGLDPGARGAWISAGTNPGYHVEGTTHPGDEPPLCACAPSVPGTQARSGVTASGLAVSDEAYAQLVACLQSESAEDVSPTTVWPSVPDMDPYDAR
jgi:hypothetical protein